MELDTKCYKALELLYKNADGIPFEGLDIDDSAFLFLRKQDYLSEPEGECFDAGVGAICIHKGLVQIEPLGRAYVESNKAQKRQMAKENRRYWITTGIAIIALIKSFLPEILAILAQLWPPA